MRIELTNSISRVWGSADELAALDAATSYPVDDAKYSAAFRSGQWDGREHLLRASRHSDAQLIPTGVLVGLTTELDGVELVDLRRKPLETRAIEWIGKPLRDYQVKAVDLALQDRGWQTGRGLWNLPIRSGKTFSAASLIQRSGLRTLFVVSSKGLLDQTLESFQSALSPCPVGVMGDGKHDTDWITIATAQTLLAQPRLAKKLMSEVDLLIVDEAHHMEGEAWRTMLLQSDAMYKIGLSATIFVSRDKENNKSSIWLRACTGPILYRVSMDRLMKQGFLKSPLILFYRCMHNAHVRQKEWQWVLKNQICTNLDRNKLIADIAVGAANRGMRVLIDTGRHDQMKQIFTLVNRRGVRCEQIHGGTSMDRRKELVGEMAAAQAVLVGTVLGEGIDIPELEVVINAEGQKSAIAAIQRMRNLTMLEGKGEVHFIDIADIGSPILQKHANERMKLYKGLRGFRVRACLLNDPDSDPILKPKTK